MVVTRVEEMVVDGIPLAGFLPEFEVADLDRHPLVAERFVGEGVTMTLSFHTFALAVGGRRILVDTGRGSGKER